MICDDLVTGSRDQRINLGNNEQRCWGRSWARAFKLKLVNKDTSGLLPAEERLHVTSAMQDLEWAHKSITNGHIW